MLIVQEQGGLVVEISGKGDINMLDSTVQCGCSDWQPINEGGTFQSGSGQAGL